MNRLTARSISAVCTLLGISAWPLVDATIEGAEPPGARVPASQPSPADWPTYNYNVAGWRFNAAEKTLNPANVWSIVEKWRFPTAESKEAIGVLHAKPAVVGGEVYFGTATFPAFYKLAADGNLLWVYRNAARKSILPPTDGQPVPAKLGAAAQDGGVLASALVNDGAV